MKSYSRKTIVLEMDDHEAWVLAQALTKLPDFYKGGDDPFLVLAREVSEKLDKMREAKM